MATRRAVTALRSLAWVMIFVALAAAAASWFTPRPDLDRDDAVETALDSLEDAGVEAAVGGRVTPGTFRTKKGQEIDVWIVPVEVGDEVIELQVQQAVGRLAFVDDVIGPDKTERLLSDDEYAVLESYRNDVTTERWARRNGAAAVAALPIAGVGYVLAKRSGPLLGSP